MSRALRWVGYGLGSLLTLLLLVAVGASATAYWTRYPARSAPDAEETVIEGGQRLAPHRDTVRSNTRLVVDGDRIACVGDTCEAPDDARRIDASGHTILPGLLDLHVHFDAPAGNDLDATVPFASMMWSYVRHRPDVRRAFLEHGVTTVRSVGDPVGYRYGTLKRKRQIAQRTLAGPRLLTAGPTVTAPGGHPAGTIYEGNDWLIRHATRQVTHPDTARGRVQALAKQGADGIKLVYEAGSPERGRLPRLDRDVMVATIDEAHEQDLWVAAHTSTAEEVRHVLEAGGVHTIEHGAYRDTLSADLIETMQTQNVVYVPTLAVVESLIERFDVPDEALQVARHNVRRLHERGVAIGAGTDTQGPTMHFGQSLHRELKLLVEAGLTPTEALSAATFEAAQSVGQDDILGHLAPGTAADLFLVEGQPWRDIDTVGNVRLVMKSGRIVSRRETDPS